VPREFGRFCQPTAPLIDCGTCNKATVVADLKNKSGGVRFRRSISRSQSFTYTLNPSQAPLRFWKMRQLPKTKHFGGPAGPDCNK
jgi:hypothetical protein